MYCNPDILARKMSILQLLLLLPISLSIFMTELLHPCYADVGTASQYGPPYVPTACYGSDVSEFPSDNLFASAGDEIWGDGAACGSKYLVRCLSAAEAGTCVEGSTIQITIVDQAKAAGSTMVLSETAFGTIAGQSATTINIEFESI
ncbi:hypothetical protein Ancab_035319 [Ancistrocladus abbreviatus]